MRTPRFLLDFDAEVAKNRFIFGFAVTFFVVLMVPMIADVFLQPVLNEIFGEGSLALFSSSLLVTLFFWILVFLMKMVGSGPRVMRMLGIPGVAGLLLAYYVIGNLWGAFMPIASIIFFAAWNNREIYLDGYRCR